MADEKQVKYIIVTGGVLSGLGKGIATASLGHLLSYDYTVVPIKCDGYLNVDPGTMNPVEHGEVFVLDDGTEVDMDFGHYERFLNTVCTGKQNLTMGKVFAGINQKEREGAYLGKTVQFIPHGAEYILDWWEEVALEQKADVVMIEIGGTVGDMENELYLEAAKRLKLKYGAKNVFFAHLTYVPIPAGVNEQKSKPTQQSTGLLLQRGVQPDAILCRCEEMVNDSIKQKISTFSSVPLKAIISAIDVDNVYKIPLLFYEQGLLSVINKRLCLKAKPDLARWKKLVNQQYDAKQKTTIAICGKYTALEDSYASVVEALHHAGAQKKTSIDIIWVDTEAIEQDNEKLQKQLANAQGVVVPGGFGSRGIEGKINVVKYCRENNIPYLGLCYGLQLAVIEFMRNVCGKSDAHTTEVNPKTNYPVIDILPDKKDLKNLGGTLRLGSYEAHLGTPSLVSSLYGGKTVVYERHRHRYEVNPKYHELLEQNGLRLSGFSPDGELVEFIELPNNSYFVGTQAHPELKSSLRVPAPLFVGLVGAALEK